MSPRDAILAAVRRNQPQPAVPLPEIPVTSRKGVKTCLGYKEHFARLPEVPGFPHEGEPILPFFRTASRMASRGLMTSSGSRGTTDGTSAEGRPAARGACPRG